MTKPISVAELREAIIHATADTAAIVRDTVKDNPYVAINLIELLLVASGQRLMTHSPVLARKYPEKYFLG
jgi:hypothetical protein